jgi:uncharacterized protein
VTTRVGLAPHARSVLRTYDAMKGPPLSLGHCADAVPEAPIPSAGDILAGGEPRAGSDRSRAGSWPHASRFQILSLDGGGLKGVFSAAVLAALEEDLNVTITEHFDLIAGTSTGGIIALALGIGMRPREVVEFYTRLGPSVFPDAPRRRLLRRLRRSRYESGPLREALGEVFGTRLLGDSAKRLVIPSYDIGEDDVHLFRTPHIPRLRRDWRVRMVDVALATSAAPTYLPACMIGSSRLVDGGVWANNPTMVAVTEAAGELGQSLDSLRVLSIGTTSEVRDRPTRLDHGGYVAWAFEVTDVLLRGQARTAYNEAVHLLGRKSVVRIDPVVAEGQFRLDLARADRLLSKASKHSRDWSPEVAQKFLDHRAPAYVPHNMTRTGADDARS